MPRVMLELKQCLFIVLFIKVFIIFKNNIRVYLYMSGYKKNGINGKSFIIDLLHHGCYKKHGRFVGVLWFIILANHFKTWSSMRETTKKFLKNIPSSDKMELSNNSSNNKSYIGIKYYIKLLNACNREDKKLYPTLFIYLTVLILEFPYDNNLSLG